MAEPLELIELSACEVVPPLFRRLRPRSEWWCPPELDSLLPGKIDKANEELEVLEVNRFSEEGDEVLLLLLIGVVIVRDEDGTVC